MEDLPRRARDYIGPVTDTRIWDDFDFRSGDIVLSTPPKSGTTWSQAILMMLIHGDAVGDRPVWQDSLWLDCGFRDQQACMEKLAAQTHRRCIKSHTPFDGIPYKRDVQYISVYRHPIDVFFSLKKHVSNMKADILDFHFQPGQDDFKRFLEEPATDTGTDELTLSSILHHYQSFAKWAHLPNVHLFHYAALSDDLTGHIRKYADVLAMTPSDDLVYQINDAASFGAMKETMRTSTSAQSASVFHVAHEFFDSATSNKWEGLLTEAQFAAYRTRFSALAGPDVIDWLETGRCVKPS